MTALNTSGPETDIHALISRTGAILRMLHDTIREVGLDDAIIEIAGSIPDARERLSHVIKMTDIAAGQVLTSVENTQPRQTLLANEAGTLSVRWDEWNAGAVSPEKDSILVQDTREWLSSVSGHTQFTREQLQSIMMAQSFQDLTGQIVKRMTSVLNEVEKQFLLILREKAQTLPPERTSRESKLESPSTGITEAEKASSQDEVDDLLDSLGF